MLEPGESGAWRTPTGSAASTRPSSPSSAAARTCTSGSVLVFEGEAPPYDEFVGEDRAAAAPGAALPPEARLPAARSRAAPVWIDDPHFNARYHVRHTALPAPAGEEELRSLAGRIFAQAARSLQAAVGDLAGRPRRRRRVRADLQDPPRARRRRLGRGHLDRAVRPRARPAGARPGAAPGTRGPSRARPCCSPTSVAERAVGAAGRRPRRARRRAPSRARGRRRRAGRSRGSRRWPPPGSPARRRARSTSASARTGASRGSTRTSSASRRSSPRSAAPSTTSCSPPSPARCARFVIRRGRDPEGMELKAMVPVSRARRTPSAARSATASPRCTRRCRSTPRTPGERFDIVHEAMGGLKESGQAVGAEVLTRLAGLRARRRCSTRRRGCRPASASSTSS